MNPDVAELLEANRRGCTHEQRGTLHRAVGSGMPDVYGCYMEAYYGCLQCKKALRGEFLLQELAKLKGQSNE